MESLTLEEYTCDDVIEDVQEYLEEIALKDLTDAYTKGQTHFTHPLETLKCSDIIRSVRYKAHKMFTCYTIEIILYGQACTINMYSDAGSTKLLDFNDVCYFIHHISLEAVQFINGTVSYDPFNVLTWDEYLKPLGSFKSYNKQTIDR